MAKNQMTGKIAKIYDTVAIPTKSGSTFNKREIILDCTTYDRYTGEPTPNYILFEFSGQRCDILDQFKKDDMVTISFVLQGSVFQDQNTKQNRVITHAVGFECVPFVSQKEQQVVQPQPSAAQHVQSQPQTQQEAVVNEAQAPELNSDGALPF